MEACSSMEPRLASSSIVNTWCWHGDGAESCWEMVNWTQNKPSSSIHKGFGPRLAGMAAWIISLAIKLFKPCSMWSHVSVVCSHVNVLHKEHGGSVDPGSMHQISRNRILSGILSAGPINGFRWWDGKSEILSSNSYNEQGERKTRSIPWNRIPLWWHPNHHNFYF